MTNPIYEPKGAAYEYADYAINIYTECPHGCWYCYARKMAERFGGEWTGNVKPREGILEALEKQLSKGKLKNERVHLCFGCDPYPRGHDTSITREIIKLIKNSGNNVQILTKNIERAERDFDLLDSNDWIGITLTGEETHSPIDKYFLEMAYNRNICTFISFEPILDHKKIMEYLPYIKDYVNKIAFGKLTGCKEAKSYDWKKIGRELADKAFELNILFYIKESLKKEMQK
ncbi:MAG: DUF5131 family protein [Endomicrobium sp.]|jgi:DNA repair photolyase|nr:DUF5131 family protein [Endomicrobium sp.]